MNKDKIMEIFKITGLIKLQEVIIIEASIKEELIILEIKILIEEAGE